MCPPCGLKGSHAPLKPKAEILTRFGMQTSPMQTGDCLRALSSLVLQFGLVRIGLTSYGSASRQSGVGRIISAGQGDVKHFLEGY
jgi:hypothetical protein